MTDYSYCVLPGAGSSGLAWAPTIERLGGTLLPVPDEPSVPRMAAALRAQVRQLPGPLVLVGASLGAMVALELAREIQADALVLIAAGFGIAVSDAVLDRVAADPPDLFPGMARASIADRENQRQIEVITRDFASRGQPVLLRHLRALGAYQPRPLPAPPPTLVIWGTRDRSVPLADHAELALQCRGALVPLAGAAHKPFLEQPALTAHWIRQAARLPAPGGDS
jgi:pimeloyl-ACP methyl ester carboxylesterase